MDWVSEIASKFPVETLSEELQMMSEILGVERLLRLSESFGGMTIYIPKIEGLVRNQRDQLIRDQFTGFNHRKLAMKYKLTETAIRSIVRDTPG